LKENLHQFNFRFHKEKEMVTFRKSLLLLAVIAMTASVASAQLGVTPSFSCSATTGVPPLVRAEGLAELVGDIVLNCTGGTPTVLGTEVPKVNVRVFVNTNVTSWLLEADHTNEALLMIDDPMPGDQHYCDWIDGVDCSIDGVGGEPGVDYADEYNVFPGQAVFGNVISDGNTIDWLGIPIDPPGTRSARIIRITNVRANAAQKGVGGGLIPSQIIAYVSLTGTTSVPIDNPELVVAFVQDGLTFSADSETFLQCEPDGDIPIELTFTERFATAFMVEGSSNQNIPGAVYNTENGFTGVPGAGPAGMATYATRLVAHFTDIPAGVTLTLSGQNVNSPDPTTQWAWVVAGADSTGAGGTPQTSNYTITPSGGSATATWEVMGASALASQDFVFTVTVNYTPNTTAGIPGLGTGAVAGSYGPISDIQVATMTDLQPRFIDDSVAEDFMTINPCATNLLWPYVTNQAGFDTGLVISNTSKDPFGTAWQQGSCDIYYYGNSDGADAPAMQTTPEVPAGDYAIWSLNNGGTVKMAGGDIAPTPGFEGYVIAHCRFQYAHGYGFISDLGAQKLAQGYIALILDESIWGCEGPCGSRTGSKSEPLNQ
jgi:hypothetical protein